MYYQANLFFIYLRYSNFTKRVSKDQKGYQKMKKSVFPLPALLFVLFFPVLHSAAQSEMIYNCEQALQNWNIPNWSEHKDDYVSPILALDKNFTSKGELGLKLMVNFSGDKWEAGIVETEGFFDLTLYKAITCTLYLSKKAPRNISARIVVASGKDHTWIEMNNSTKVTPGRTTKVSGNLRYGNSDWRTTEGTLKMTDEIKSSIKKIAIRIESNEAKYTGPVYIDSIHFEK